jgi:hypothetical protein
MTEFTRRCQQESVRELDYQLHVHHVAQSARINAKLVKITVIKVICVWPSAIGVNLPILYSVEVMCNEERKP